VGLYISFEQNDKSWLKACTNLTEVGIAGMIMGKTHVWCMYGILVYMLWMRNLGIWENHSRRS
jgi:hypothetical protein